MKYFIPIIGNVGKDLWKNQVIKIIEFLQSWTFDCSYWWSIFSMTTPSKYWAIVHAFTFKKSKIIWVSKTFVSLVSSNHIWYTNFEGERKLNILEVSFVYSNVRKFWVNEKICYRGNVNKANDYKHSFDGNNYFME